MTEILNTIQEIWKPIVNYEDLYEISNYGKIKRLAGKGCKKERILKCYKANSYGHLQIDLCKNNIINRCHVHRLVLETFVGPCPLGMECCHNDGNPSNNFVGNLRYDTHKNNINDKIKHGTNNYAEGSKGGNAKLNDKQIIEIRESKLKYKELAIKYSVGEAHISRIKNKKRWKHI